MEEYLYKKYDSMTTEELEHVIEEDSYKISGELDVAELLYISSLLAKRKSEETPDVENALAEFKEHYASEIFGYPAEMEDEV